MACYSGENPIQSDEERLGIWKWAKEHGGIDAGEPYEKVHQNVNNAVFGGMGDPKWVDEIIAGRKSPLRPFVLKAWQAAYNRRAITQAAQDRIRQQAMSPAARTIAKVLGVPRAIAVWGHGWVFPLTHAG